MKKFILLVLLAVSSISSNAQSVREFQLGPKSQIDQKINLTKHSIDDISQSIGQGYILHTVTFADDNTGYVAGDYAIWKTTNAGELFTASLMYDSSLTDSSHIVIIYDIKAFGDTVYAIGYDVYGHNANTSVFITHNAGQNWTTLHIQDSLNGVNTSSLNCINQNTIFVCGVFGEIVKTTDGFKTWSQELVSYFPVICYDISFQNGVAFVAGENYCYKSPDMLSWEYTNSTGVVPLAMTSNNQSIILAGLDTNTISSITHAGVSYSSNGGQSWVKTLYPYYGGFREVGFEGTTAYMVGWGGPKHTLYLSEMSGYAYSSTDNGASWQEIYRKDSTAFTDYAKTTSYMYYVGYGGVVVRVGSPIGIENQNTNIPKTASLDQNYPNPFNPTTKISYSIPKKSVVKITIYNVIGKEINVLVNQSQNAGDYSVEFSGINISSGIYFYKLETDKFTETKKMVLVK